MRTDIPAQRLSLPGVAAADAILRACVHCGFCNATCPTYLLTGNELESPRGRIYLLKSLLEDRIEPTARTLSHIDHCLGCLSCETTCPSGVTYGRLLEDGRQRLEPLRRRGSLDRWRRALLTHLLPHPRRLRLALRLGRGLRSLRRWLPEEIADALDSIPARLTTPETATPGVHRPRGATRRRVVLLTGCVQQVMGAEINDAAVRLLIRHGVEVTLAANPACCGALPHHMGERRHSRRLMQRSLRDWDALLLQGVEAIVLTTSGCQTTVRDYGHLFAGSDQAAAAERVAAASVDISELLVELGLTSLRPLPALRVAYHDACSLQHGLHLSRPPRELLCQTGIEVIDIPEGHICCGSAGTYHLLHPRLARQLRSRKAEQVRCLDPDLVAAGNIGCLQQIGRDLPWIPVVHTVQLLDWATGGPCPPPLRALASRRAPVPTAAAAEKTPA